MTVSTVSTEMSCEQRTGQLHEFQDIDAWGCLWLTILGKG